MAMVRKAGGGKPEAAVRQVINQCLQRDAGWKTYYNHKIRDVAKKELDIDVPKITLAEQERRAHTMAYNNSLVDAAENFKKAIHEAQLDGEELGIYLQRLSRITYLTDPAESMKLQQGARERNRALAVPPAMPRKPSIPGGKTVAEKMCAWFSKFSNANAAVIEANRIADALDLNQPAHKVEAALLKLGEAIGADSTRPEEEYSEGPDNVWFWGNHTFVIEAKSGNEHSLHKKDSGQLHDSLQWARDSYPQFAERLLPIIVARVTKVDGDSNFPADTRILTQAGCTAMGKALHQLTQKLAQMGPVFATPEMVLAEMINFKLHPDQFIGNHTVSPE